MKTLLSFLLLLSFNLMAADDETEKNYRELHRRLREQVLKGFQDHDEFVREMDQMMEQMMRDSLGPNGFGRMQGLSAPTIATEWSETTKGRTLEISPASKDTKLDVQVKGGMIVIESETVTKHSQGRFSQSQSIPQDCDPDGVEMESKEGKLLVHFPWIKSDKNTSTQSQKKPKPVSPQKKNRGPIDV
jgi:hypothetical protein